MAMSMTQRLRYEGRMEGRMEGCIGTWHKSILSLLTKRLGTVPAMIRERILDMHDEIALESLNIGSCTVSFMGRVSRQFAIEKRGKRTEEKYSTSSNLVSELPLRWYF